MTQREEEVADKASDFCVLTRLLSGGTFNHAQAGLYEPAPLSVGHSQFLSPAPPCYRGASTHRALPFAQDWSSQTFTVPDSHPSSPISARRDLNEEETETDSAMESDLSNESEWESEPKKPKRSRTSYSNFQLDELELVFCSNPYPDYTTREELGQKIGVAEDRIQVWFQNKRARSRKQVSRSPNRKKHIKRLQEEYQAAMQLSYHSSPSFVFQSTSSQVPGTCTGISNFMSGSPISAAPTSPFTLYPVTANYLNRTPTVFSNINPSVTAPADNK